MRESESEGGVRETRKTLRRIMSSTSSGDLWDLEVAIRVENWEEEEEEEEGEEEGDQRTQLCRHKGYEYIFCLRTKKR